MILPYGPVPLTAGIVTSQDVDSSAAWVVVENVSLFLYLGVSFWPSKPPAVTVFNGQPWNAVIQPGGTLRIPCPPQGWLGRIWLLGVDASGQSAATGTVSGYSAALLRTYGTDDTPSDSPSVVRGLDILSQPRVISVPMTPFFSFSASGMALNNNTDAGFFPTVVAATSPLSDQGCVVYLYYAQLLSQGGNGSAFVSVRLRIKDATTFAVIQTIDIAFGTLAYATPVAGSFDSSPWTFDPSYPLPVPIQRAGAFANMGLVEIDFHCVVVAPAGLVTAGTLLADSDKISHIGNLPVAVPGIGGGANVDIFTGGQPKY